MILTKLTHIVLSFLLLVTTSGITVHKHYSGNQLYSRSVYVEARSCCQDPCSCCHETMELIKIKDNFLASHFNLKILTSINNTFIPVLIFISALKSETPLFFSFLWDTLPPPLPDIYLFNQVFRL